MTGRPPASLDRRIRGLADWLGFALLWGWITVSFLFVPAWLGYPTVGIVLGLVAIVLCSQAAKASSHPVWTVGTRREVTSERITEPGHDCDECGRPAMGGVRRRYTKRRVLFGTTVAVPDWGENRYCKRCAQGPPLEDVHADRAVDHDGDRTDDATLERNRT